MTKVYEILEICLKGIEHGADVDTVLFRYPEFEKELRPILEASVKAKSMAPGAPPEEVAKRGRAKVLQRAAQMREAKAAPASRRVWSVPLRRALVTLAMVAMLFVSGTGLVRASSSSLPGDNLYPVKRTWEGLSLFFTFDTAKREALEFEHENERLKELRKLLAKGRSAEVEFAGYVTRQFADEWQLSGITVFVSPETGLPEQPVVVGAAVRVKGRIQNNGVVAERIEVLPPGYRLPEAEDEDSLEIAEEGEGANQPIGAQPVSGSATEAPKVTATMTSALNPTPEELSVEGVISSMANNFIVVNGTLIDIQFAEVKGTPFVGAVVKAEGYFDSTGVFIAAKIEFKGAPPGSAPPTSNEGGSQEDNGTGNDNDNNDDNGNGNNNGNDNDNDDNDDNGDND